MRLFAHLWTGAEAPLEYTNMRFYREFGWTPEQLRSQRLSDILAIIEIWRAEAKVGKLKGRHHSG